MENEDPVVHLWVATGGQYPSGGACVRQTDVWCHPGGSPVDTLCAPAGLVRQAGAGDSGCGRTGVQSGRGRHTQDLKTTKGKTKLGLRTEQRKTDNGTVTM